jgi:hypothetical protein
VVGGFYASDGTCPRGRLPVFLRQQRQASTAASRSTSQIPQADGTVVDTPDTPTTTSSPASWRCQT